MPVGAPLGNNNAAKGKLWTDAIKRALARRSDTVEGGLNDLADTFIEAVANGDAWAMRELGDRLEGKPAQTNILGNEDPDGFKTVTEIRNVIVDAKS